MKKDVTIEHQEHDIIEIPPGIKMEWIQQGDVKLYSLDGKLYFKNKKNVTIEQGHDIIEIPTGIWEISKIDTRRK
jgi:hypothetical protein